MRKTFVEIDLGSLVKNARKLWDLNGQENFFCPMIKANAYGHGAVECARALKKMGMKNLGVSLVEEGIELRLNHIGGPVLVFGSFDSGLDEIIENNLVPVISTEEQVRAIENFHQRGGFQKGTKDPEFQIHLKVDTGMNRLGFFESELSDVLKRLDRISGLRISGALTHLASPEDMSDDKGMTAKQIEIWKRLRQVFTSRKAALHLFSSTALINRDRSKFKDLSTEGARPGLALYGSVLPGITEINFDPVMTFRSSIVATRRVSKGEAVSYGGTWVAPNDTLIGTVTAGYADGVSRSLSNQGEVTIEGQRYPIRGRICMDYFMIDLGLAKPADYWLQKEVVLFGKEASLASDLAILQNTSAYEVLTQVSGRVPRRFINERQSHD